MSVAADAHKQRLLIEQRDPTRKRMYVQPCLERLLHGLRHRHLALAAALAAHEQP